MGGFKRRAKSLRNGVHRANAVVQGGTSAHLKLQTQPRRALRLLRVLVRRLLHRDRGVFRRLLRGVRAGGIESVARGARFAVESSSSSVGRSTCGLRGRRSKPDAGRRESGENVRTSEDRRSTNARTGSRGTWSDAMRRVILKKRRSPRERDRMRTIARWNAPAPRAGTPRVESRPPPSRVRAPSSRLRAPTRLPRPP
ncbi:uncharacterized protein MICPUCDRAFT_65219 [Micromonas pusilla CCMP1545]|uniref:Predicted protein n=1 Tax=Micromonas pusilla (strain CCMP1545) TaxID=564608 RepID=C1MJI1_MICPC|nr:uncharacterized protein MICPUCDRAFT_65219 [Micromonas pusilla CCMP1545]EEH60003.1 predicted protein [Micromonas pusilla CCMP1545]|eukprot:XP_003056627.1 predicted protein [Micromonas pusilla CCMP1545]